MRSYTKYYPGYTQNIDFPWVKSHFPVGKRSSGTATNRPLQKRERTGKEYGCFPFD